MHDNYKHARSFATENTVYSGTLYTGQTFRMIKSTPNCGMVPYKFLFTTQLSAWLGLPYQLRDLLAT